MGGLQSNVYIESLLIEKQKLGYNDVGTGAAAEASVRYQHVHFVMTTATSSCLFAVRYCCALV